MNINFIVLPILFQVFYFVAILQHLTLTLSVVRRSSVGRTLYWESRVAGLSLTKDSVTGLYLLENYFLCCLVLIQPRKTHPGMTEKLITGM